MDNIKLLGWWKRSKKPTGQHQHVPFIKVSNTMMDLKTLNNFGGFQPQNLFSCVKGWNRFITAVWTFPTSSPKNPPEKKVFTPSQKQTKNLSTVYSKARIKQYLPWKNPNTYRFCVEQLGQKNHQHRRKEAPPSSFWNPNPRAPLHSPKSLPTKRRLAIQGTRFSTLQKTTVKKTGFKRPETCKEYDIPKISFHKSSFKQKLHCIKRDFWILGG